MAVGVPGRGPGEKFHEKFVLIGPPPPSPGDRIPPPFLGYTDARADQHGALMPGVEVLANAVNVILRSRYYTDTPDMSAFLWGALVAVLTLILLESAQGRHELLKQLGVLIGIGSLIPIGGYIA